MLLCYSALSPFCRKVRMVLDWKGVAVEIFDSCDVRKYPAYNPRAEIPVLVDEGLTVVNSADILAYVDRKLPTLELYPRDAAAYAVVRAWEREADTLVDAIVTDAAIWKWANLPPPPEGLIDAARRDLAPVLDRMESALVSSDFIAGSLSVADFALYPHIGAARLLGLTDGAVSRPGVDAWLRRLRETSWGSDDLALVRAWWLNRETQDVDTRRINWGTHRLEWFMANGFHDRFLEEIRADRVLWSVGPHNNALNSPLTPARA